MPSSALPSLAADPSDLHRRVYLPTPPLPTPGLPLALLAWLAVGKMIPRKLQRPLSILPPRAAIGAVRTDGRS